MSDGERRLVFDTGGKRKHVVRVVYAILALLMGGSLFLVIGPFSIGELIGGSSSTSSAAAVFDEQAERIERRLAKSPEDEQLLLTLTRAQISAGNAQVEAGAESGLPVPAREDFEAGMRSWDRYLKQAGNEPSAALAQLVASTSFALAETGSTNLEDVESNIANAAAAQRIAAAQQPNLGSLSTLALYEYYDGNFAAGDRALERAVVRSAGKAEAEGIEKQLDEYRKRAKIYTKQAAKAEKVLQKAGKEQLQNPLQGIAPPGSALGE